MGARLVSQVLARWTHVSDRAFRVLVRMALTALDEPNNGTPASVYFGGRDLLAMTLRRERGGDLDTAYKTVKRAIADLIDEGAIERTASGRSGQNAVYHLRLDAARRIDGPPVDNPCGLQSQGDTSRPPQGDTSRPPQGDTRSPARGTPADPPRNQEEPLEELLEEPRGNLRTTVTVARAHEADANPDPSNNTPKINQPSLRLVDTTEPPIGEPRGNGFCIHCYADTGAAVLALDPVHGALCATHTRGRLRAVPDPTAEGDIP